MDVNIKDLLASAGKKLKSEVGTSILNFSQIFS